MSGKVKKGLSYEEAIVRLEEIVRRLEDEAIPLEETLTCFQEGIRLSRYCREKLVEIEFKVEHLLKDEQNLQDNSRRRGIRGNEGEEW